MFASMEKLHTQRIRFAVGSPTNDRWIGWCKGMGVVGCNGLKICWLTFPTVLGLASSLGWLFETFWDSKDLMVVFPNCSLGPDPARPRFGVGRLPPRSWASWWLSVGILVAFSVRFSVFPAARPGRNGSAMEPMEGFSLRSRCHALSV